MSQAQYAHRIVQLVGVYTCSKCSSVILIPFSLKASGGSKNGKADAVRALNKGIQKLTNALENFPEKPFLVTITNDGRAFSSGYGTEFENANERCPFCGNEELWQRGSYYADVCTYDDETGVKLVANVPEESRMHVFGSLEMASRWAMAIMQQKRNEATLYWSDKVDEAKSVGIQITDIKNKLVDLEKQNSVIKEKSQILAAQIAEKEAEIKKCSILSSGRRIAKTELKNLKRQYEIQLASEQEPAKRITNEINVIKKQLIELQIANYGVLNEEMIISGKNVPHHVAYRLS